MKAQQKQANYELAEKLLAEQNWVAALVAGAIATPLAAVAYGITVAVWDFSYGFAAAGIGVLVGFAVGSLGRGISTKFSVAAALFTIAGCVLGNLLRAAIEMRPASATSLLHRLQSNSIEVVADRFVSNLTLIDLVFWFVAVFAAVFLAKRYLSRAERLAIGLLKMRG